MILITNAEYDEFFPVIKSKFDRKGVMRRNLFQAVSKDVRLQTKGHSTVEQPQHQKKESGGSSCDVASSIGVVWPDFLRQVCEDASIDEHYEKLHAAASDLGVAWGCELIEVAEDLADKVGLKVLERRRFLAELK